MTASKRMALVFFPYLPLRRPADIGPARLVPVSEFAGPWASPRFESLCARFMASFVGADRQPLDAGALLVHPSDGCDGILPTADERLAFQRAVELAGLDTNPPWSENAQAWKVVTSDNLEMHAWPIDLESGAVTLTSGFVASTMHGGLSITDGLVVPAPEELHLPMGKVALDDGVLSGAYRQFLPSGEAVDDRARRRLRDSVGWLSKAWRNTPSVDWSDRIVLLKTGFESLTGESKTHKAAAALRALFERVVGTAGVPTDDMLWSAEESPERTYVDRSGKEWPCTDLEHWFRSFGEVRNAVIHGDIEPKAFDYAETDSAYSGPMFHTAERLLREGTKVALADRGETLLYASSELRWMVARLEEESTER